VQKPEEVDELTKALLTLVFSTMVNQGMILQALSQQGYLTEKQMEKEAPLASEKAALLLRYLAPTREEAKSWLEICQRGWREMGGARFLTSLGRRVGP